MFAMGFELSVIKRRGWRISNTPRKYLWRDEHIVAHIGRGTVARATVPGHGAQQSAGREGGKRSRPTEQDYRRRLVEISKTMSGAIRHRRIEEMGGDGLVRIKNVCNVKRPMKLNTTMGGIRLIVNGGGGKQQASLCVKPVIAMYPMFAMPFVWYRCSPRHSASCQRSGVYPPWGRTVGRTLYCQRRTATGRSYTRALLRMRR